MDPLVPSREAPRRRPTLSGRARRPLCPLAGGPAPASPRRAPGRVAPPRAAGEEPGPTPRYGALSKGLLALFSLLLLTWASPAAAHLRAASPPSFAAALQDTLRIGDAPESLLEAWTIGPFEVTRVVDGDTIHVRRDGGIEKLRLLSVDTEEKLDIGVSGTTSKPGTIFGEETSLWAQELFQAHADEDGTTRVQLLIPRGEEQHDVFGRLLCHVLLPDGQDFNLLLVHRGKSPYYTKYGYSEIHHDAFRAAEQRARDLRIGIWDPAVNQPATPGLPAAQRPYDRLLPWWDARARAIEDFRRRSTQAPLEVLGSDASERLTRALLEGPREITLFGEIDRLFEEQDGSLTVLFRGGARDKRVRARISPGARPAHDGLELAGRTAEYRQNFLYVRGLVRQTSRGFELDSLSPDQWQVAGPEPGLAESEAPERAPAPAPCGAGG